MSTLTINNFEIHARDGLFSLNDLHKASGRERKNRPAEWLRNQQTKDLIAEMQKVGIPTFKTFRGKNGGTYIGKEGVIAYAAWISAAFHLLVIRTFLQVMDAPAIPYAQNPSDTLTAEEADQLRAFLTSEAVKQYPNNTKKQGEFLKLGWSRLKAHFKVSYRQIPRAQLAEALSIIGRFSAAHRESYTPTLLGRTFIVYVDADGTESIKEKPVGAGINRTEDWARMVREPGGLMMSQDWHEDLSMACFERMTPERKLKSLERQLAYMNEQVDGEKVKMRWLA